MVKVKVIKNMIDKNDNWPYREGSFIEVKTKKRYDELLKAGVIEKIEDTKVFDQSKDK